MTSSAVERFLGRIEAGERLSAADIAQLAAAPDILPLGMLADTLRRRLHGSQTTYLRVAPCAVEDVPLTMPAAAGEVRLTGSPETLDAAVRAVEGARARAGGRALSGFSWRDVERLAAEGGTSVSRVLTQLREGGLDALAEVPIDGGARLADVLEQLVGAGYQRVRLTVDTAPADARAALLLDAAGQDRHACVYAINPLPMAGGAFRPTTGYEDVKMVAIARLAAPGVPTIQVDWSRYGPKLAQVALTFGADDLDGVSASDEAPEGRRRAPLEEVRRNIEAAGFRPTERDGRFNVIA